MNRLSMTIIAALTALPLTAISLTVSAKEVSVSVKGMVCGFCAQGIEKKFKALPEVSTVNVSLETKIVKINTKGEQNISDATINAILKEAGYNVEKIERGGKI